MSFSAGHKMYIRIRLRLTIYKVGFGIVGTAELETMFFSKTQGRLKHTWSTSVSNLDVYIFDTGK